MGASFFSIQPICCQLCLKPISSALQFCTRPYYDITNIIPYYVQRTGKS